MECLPRFEGFVWSNNAREVLSSVTNLPCDKTLLYMNHDDLLRGYGEFNYKVSTKYWDDMVKKASLFGEKRSGKYDVDVFIDLARRELDRLGIIRNFIFRLLITNPKIIKRLSTDILDTLFKVKLSGNNAQSKRVSLIYDREKSKLSKVATTNPSESSYEKNDDGVVKMSSTSSQPSGLRKSESAGILTEESLQILEKYYGFDDTMVVPAKAHRESVDDVPTVMDTQDSTMIEEVVLRLEIMKSSIDHHIAALNVQGQKSSLTEEDIRKALGAAKRTGIPQLKSIDEEYILSLFGIIPATADLYTVPPIEDSIVLDLSNAPANAPIESGNPSQASVMIADFVTDGDLVGSQIEEQFSAIKDSPTCSGSFRKKLKM